jgi:hypothetical protein
VVAANCANFRQPTSVLSLTHSLDMEGAINITKTSMVVGNDHPPFLSKCSILSYSTLASDDIRRAVRMRCGFFSIRHYAHLPSVFTAEWVASFPNHRQGHNARTSITCPCARLPAKVAETVVLKVSFLIQAVIASSSLTLTQCLSTDFLFLNALLRSAFSLSKGTLRCLSEQ